MGIITLNCFKNGGTLRNMCNILLRKFTKKRIVIYIVFIVLASFILWMFDDLEQEKFKLRFANYVTPLMMVMKIPFRDIWKQKIYHRVNITKPGVADDILAMEPPPYLSYFKNPCWYEKMGEESLQRHCLPYFYLLGVDKCGTTDLFSRMLRHPQILRTDAVNSKETHWWSWRRFGFDVFVKDAKIQSFDDYLKVFDSTSDRLNMTQIFGDGSPTYFWDFTGWPQIPQNKGRTEPKFLTPHCIRHLTPNAKFIIILRNPIERLYSDYLFLFRKNVSPTTFHRGVVSAINFFDHCERLHGTRSCLFDKRLHMNTHVRLLIGMYGNYLLEWLDVFPVDQFLILKTEEYRNDIEGHLRKIFKFLGLAPLSSDHLKDISHGKHAFERTDKMKGLGPMSLTTRMLLKSFYSRNKITVSDILRDNRFEWK